jgi:hypothetical protein
MKKPVLGLLLGGVLGVLDGLSALVSAPETAPDIVGIVIGSTVKGLIAGLIIGWFAVKRNNLPLGIVVGLLVGLALAALVVWGQVAGGQPAYVWQILLPGSILGMIVGYATQRFGVSSGSPARG